MKSCDLSSGAAKLELAFKVLRVTISAVEQQWTDQTHQKFHENHLAAIDPNIKRYMDAVGRMAEAIAACERDCDSESSD
jgi:uncharacterized protein YukE